MIEQNTGRDNDSVLPDQNASNYTEGTSGRSADANRSAQSAGADLDPTAMSSTDEESAVAAVETQGTDRSFGTPVELDSSSAAGTIQEGSSREDDSGSGNVASGGRFRRRLELVKQRAQEIAHIRGERIMDRVHHIRDDAKVQGERVDRSIRSNTYWFVLGSFGVGILIGSLLRERPALSETGSGMNAKSKLKMKRKVG